MFFLSLQSLHGEDPYIEEDLLKDHGAPKKTKERKGFFFGEKKNIPLKESPQQKEKEHKKKNKKSSQEIYHSPKQQKHQFITSSISQGEDKVEKKSKAISRGKNTSFFSTRSSSSGSSSQKKSNIFSRSSENQGLFVTGHLPHEFSLEVLENFLKKKKYKQASLYVNRILRRHIRNAALHIINGIVYEEMAKTYINQEYYNCAQAAYLTAHRIDRKLWYPLYCLGLLEYNGGDYVLATQHLLEAFRLNPCDKETGLALTQAAYGARDLNLAYDNAQALIRQFPDCPMVLRHSAILYAVGGEFTNAFNTLEKYKKLSGITPEDITDVWERIHQWQVTHRLAFTQKAFGKGPYTINVPPEDPKDQKEKNPEENPEEKDKKKDSEMVKNPMVIFEGYAIALLDIDILNIGNNILNPVDQQGNLQDLGFLLGFEHNLTGEYQNTNNAENSTGTGDALKSNTGNMETTLNFSLGGLDGGSVNAINYSLNLINSQNECLLISARPSVSALLGKEVTFSDFNRVNGMVGGSSISVEAGVKIQFKPLKIQDDRVLLFISSTHSYLNPGYNLGRSIENQIIAVRKVVSATTTEVKSGESILLSGYSRDIDQALTRGLPGVDGIPVLGWLFSRREKLKDRRRVLFLIRVYIADKKPLKPKDYKKDIYFGTSRPVLDRVLELLESKNINTSDGHQPFINYALMEEIPEPNGLKDTRTVFQRLQLAVQGA